MDGVKELYKLSSLSEENSWRLVETTKRGTLVHVRRDEVSGAFYSRGEGYIPATPAEICSYI